MATAKKAAAKKKTTKPKVKVDGKAKVLRTEYVPVTSLTGYYKNPRVRPDVNDLEESFDENGQYKPIVVNVGTHTGRKNEILVGNHTWLALRKLGEDEIYASFIDVSEVRAAKIVAVDNKSSDRGTYDEDILKEVLSGLPDIKGTAYRQEEFDEIVKDAEAIVRDAADIADDIEQDQLDAIATERALKASKTFDGSPLGEEPDDPDAEDEDDSPAGQYGAGVDITKAKEELGGMFQFKPPQDVNFPGIGYWGIPKLLDDKLMTWDDLPEKLDSWAGSATKDWEDEEQWWLYNWGVDSTSGMRDISKVIIGFYAFDNYFDNWWWYPERYFAKVLNSGIKYMLTPNWSMASEMPRVDSLWNLYRARWIGRYAQEVGLKLCPDIVMRHADHTFNIKHVFQTLPKNAPMIAVQMQTFDPKAPKEETEKYLTDLNNIFKTIEPQSVLVYAGSQARRYLADGTIDPRTDKVRILGTRQDKLTVKAKGKQKKKTI